MLIASINLGLSTSACAESTVKADYIQNCKYATCVGIASSEWSELHPYAVAVAVRIGTKPAVSDKQIKEVLVHDLKKHGVTKYKFFYEVHNAPASVITLHVRGGTEGPYLIKNVRDNVAFVADMAKATDPVLLPSD